jgi:hypothetical protein
MASRKAVSVAPIHIHRCTPTTSEHCCLQEQSIGANEAAALCGRVHHRSGQRSLERFQRGS